MKRVILYTITVLVCMSSCEVLDDPDEGTVYGTWRCTEFSTGGSPVTYQIDINEDISRVNGIVVSNFGQLGFLFEVEATVSGNLIDIMDQQVIDQFGTTFRIIGSGTSTDGFKTMSWEYQIDGSSYTADLTRI